MRTKAPRFIIATVAVALVSLGGFSGTAEAAQGAGPAAHRLVLLSVPGPSGPAVALTVSCGRTWQPSRASAARSTLLLVDRRPTRLRSVRRR